MWTYNTALGEISSPVVKLCTGFMPSLQMTTGIQQFILFSFDICSSFLSPIKWGQEMHQIIFI